MNARVKCDKANGEDDNVQVPFGFATTSACPQAAMTQLQASVSLARAMRRGGAA